MSDASLRSAELAIRTLLDGRDVDEVSRILHNLIGEVAGLTARIELLEAKAAGKPAPQGDAIAGMVKRVVG
jgi:hypothetical protein